MADELLYQYCQKIIVFSEDRKKVLLGKRQGEQDYDGTFSFVGGKIEHTDGSILEGLRREKNEELGEDFKIRINPEISHGRYYVKKDGNHMILPHYYSEYVSGEMNVNEEYSECTWFDISELDDLEPKVENIPDTVRLMLRMSENFLEEEFEVI